MKTEVSKRMRTFLTELAMVTDAIENIHTQPSDIRFFINCIIAYLTSELEKSSRHPAVSFERILIAAQHLSDNFLDAKKLHDDFLRLHPDATAAWDA